MTCLRTTQKQEDLQTAEEKNHFHTSLKKILSETFILLIELNTNDIKSHSCNIGNIDISPQLCSIQILCKAHKKSAKYTLLDTNNYHCLVSCEASFNGNLRTFWPRNNVSQIFVGLQKTTNIVFG